MQGTMSESHTEELNALDWKKIDINSIAKKKVEFQTRGVRIPTDLIHELEMKWNAPAVKGGRIVFCLESSDTEGKLTSVLVVNGNHVSRSPFHLVKNSSGYEIWKGDGKYSDIVLLPRPKFYDSTTSDGVPMSKIAVLGEPDHIRSVVNQNCFYQQIGKSCKFCAVQQWWGGTTKKTPTQIAETVEAGVSEGVATHVSLSTGTTRTKGKGLEDLVETAKAIKDRVRINMTVNFEPLKDYSLLESLLQDAKKAGVTTVLCNIECFDESIREEIMPMKGRAHMDTYIKTWEQCLDIFGENEVYTMVIAGIGEDDESILKGVEMAASHGVVASIVPHTPMRGAEYQDMEPPTPDRMLSLYEKAEPIYEKYGLKLYGGTGGRFTSLKGM